MKKIDMTQKFNWLFNSRKRSGVWFLMVFGMVSLMLAPVSRMDSNGSNPDSEVADPAFSEFEPNLNPSLARQQSGEFAPNTSVTLECISRSAQPPVSAANRRSDLFNAGAISANGQYMVFYSAASDLILGESLRTFDNVYVYDRVSGINELVSRVPGMPTTQANFSSFYPVISADGRYVAFLSYATNLVSGQTDVNNAIDVFLFDRLTGTTELVSRVAGALTTTGNALSTEARISADGRFVSFMSYATDLVSGLIDTNGPDTADIYVYDRVTQTTELVNRVVGTTTTTGNHFSVTPVISANGNWIVFESGSTDMIPGQINTAFPDASHIYVYDREGGTVQLVSRAAGLPNTTGNNSSGGVSISSDGQWIAFNSAADNLVTGQIPPLSTTTNVYLFNRVSGTTQLVSRAAGTTVISPNSHSIDSKISGDGRYIAYASYATNLLSGQTDTNGITGGDIFVFDRVSGTTQLVSRATGTTNLTGNNTSTRPILSANGQVIVYVSLATNLVHGQTDTNEVADIFVFDRVSGETLLLSGVEGSPTTTGNAASGFPQISMSGQGIGFTTNASNLISLDLNRTQDVFLAHLIPTITGTLTGGDMLCSGLSVALTATIAGGTPPYTLTLTNGGGTQTGTSPLTFTVSPSSTTTYAIQSGTDANGNPITGSGSATVTVISCPEQSSVLVADTTNNRIQRFDGTTWSVVGPGTVGSGNGQFRVPEAVAFNTSGRIYVADTGNNRIQWSTNGGTTWATFAASGTGLNQVSGPRGLALDSIGNLYVADGGNGRVVRFNNGVPGNAVILATKGTTAGRVQTPNGLAIDISFNLFIADTGNNRIQKITSAHTKTTPNTGTQIAGLGSGLTAVRAPQGVAVDSSGNLYVADTGNNRITRFAGGNPGTATLLAGAGTALGQVRAPEGVTLSAFSTGPLVGGVSLVVSDTTNNRIQGRNLNGTTWVLVGTPNGLGTNPGQFRAPSKIR